MRFFAVPIAAVMLTACASGALAAPDNPYVQSYVSQRKAAAKSEPGAPQILLGKDRVNDYQRQLEKGYDILGYSSFEAGEVSPDKLVEQAVLVNADMALVYSEAKGRAPASLKLDQARAEAAGKKEGSATQGQTDTVAGDHVLYSYFASYWIRLPLPILGVHVQGTAEAQTGETGVVVLAVIEGSPAASELHKDDILLRLGEIKLDKPEALMQAAKRYAGQSVEVVFERDGQALVKPLKLGSR
ncbi:MAG TPA: PDZ domain-containing protein [Methylophilaceae bacterium]|nr:PDZ domain-containing protein [Methylophilaceae bacterium]